MHNVSKRARIDKQPNFFIVGAAKAGTTSLWKLLKKHPNIFMPEDELYKEPAFFSDIRPMSFQQYLDIFSSASSSDLLIGEASTC